MCLFSAPSPTSPTPPHSGPPTTIIAGSAAAAVVILVILIIGILLCRRRAKNKGNIEEISSDKLSHQFFFHNKHEATLAKILCDIVVLVQFFH